MGWSRRSDAGFTLLELMVVVLIIGILVAIAVPVYASATSDSQASACLANQRSIAGSIASYLSDGESAATASEGQLALGGSGWYDILVPGRLKSAPKCPVNKNNYLVDAAGAIVGDKGGVMGFRPGHSAQ